MSLSNSWHGCLLEGLGKKNTFEKSNGKFHVILDIKMDTGKQNLKAVIIGL